MYWAFLNYLLNIIYNNHFLKVDEQFYEWEKILSLGENASCCEKSLSVGEKFLLEKNFFDWDNSFSAGKTFLWKVFQWKKVSEWEKSFWLEERFPGRRKKVSWC